MMYGHRSVGCGEEIDIAGAPFRAPQTKWVYNGRVTMYRLSNPCLRHKAPLVVLLSRIADSQGNSLLAGKQKDATTANNRNSARVTTLLRLFQVGSGRPFVSGGLVKGKGSCWRSFCVPHRKPWRPVILSAHLSERWRGGKCVSLCTPISWIV
ncbi:hypothetical protein H4582DRAFT_1580488 [Lactarius indigo]|nr:hypothetical protein H4582DRAFT_1580488 [Lactarius indigo]